MAPRLFRVIAFSRRVTLISGLVIVGLTAVAPTWAQQAPKPGKPQPFSPFPSRSHWTLALNNQLVAPPAYDGEIGYFPIEGDRVAAYELTSGRERWLVTTKVRSAPAVGEGLLFVEQDDALVALRASDGSTSWTVPNPEGLAAPLTWVNGWLLGVTPSSLLARRATDGALLWKRDIAGAHVSPAVAANRVYVSLTDGRVMAFQVADGTPLWTRKLGGSAAVPANEILALDDRLFVGSNDNYLYCLKSADGVIDWRMQTGADVVSRPAFDTDRLYFVSLDNVLRAVNRSHGVQQWKKALPFRPVRSPIKVADVVIVSGVAGAPQAFFMKDGKAAGELTVDAASEIAAPLHAFSSGPTLGPTLVAVTFTAAGGATITAVSHIVEPVVAPFTPLPGLVQVTVPKP